MWYGMVYKKSVRLSIEDLVSPFGFVIYQLFDFAFSHIHFLTFKQDPRTFPTCLTVCGRTSVGRGWIGVKGTFSFESVSSKAPKAKNNRDQISAFEPS